jgi:hypothetical protein
MTATATSLEAVRALFPLISTPAHVLAQSADTKPNILFVLRDNLGSGEVGVYGGGVLVRSASVQCASRSARTSARNRSSSVL